MTLVRISASTKRKVQEVNKMEKTNISTPLQSANLLFKLQVLNGETKIMKELYQRNRSIPSVIPENSHRLNGESEKGALVDLGISW
jgi:hypothetical protein